MATTDGVTVAEAARRLGISKEAVRRRIDRQTLRATKSDDGTWRVLLDTESPPRDATTDTMTDDMPHGANPTTALLAEKDARINLLTDQLAKKDEQIHELHTLLAQSGLRQLPPTIDALPAQKRATDDLPPAIPQTSHRGVREAQSGLWRRFLKALGIE